jgi:hypothetical protein
LEALGADLDRIFIFDRTSTGLAEPLSFPSGAGQLDEALAHTGARLVVIDPIMAFLDSKIQIRIGSFDTPRTVTRPLTWTRLMTPAYGSDS